MYDIKNNTITVGEITYHVNREPDRGSPEETLTVTVYSMDSDEFEPAFPGLVATLGMEEVIEEWMSPRDAANIGTMCVSYDRYNLGDEEIKDIEFEIQCPTCEGSGTIDREGPVTKRDDSYGLHTVDYECEKCEGSGMIEVSHIDYFKQERGARVVLPLSVYEHSGITMFVGHQDYTFDPGGWDTSYVGFIFDTPEGIKECMGDPATISDEEITEALKAEVKLYASYLEGDVTGYYVEDEETGFSEGCGGYVGDSKYCEQQCFTTLESAIKERLNEEQERAEWAARDTMTT